MGVSGDLRPDHCGEAQRSPKIEITACEWSGVCYCGTVCFVCVCVCGLRDCLCAILFVTVTCVCMCFV